MFLAAGLTTGLTKVSIIFSSNRLNSIYSIAAVITILVVGAFMFLIMPLYVGAMVDSLGLDNQQVSQLTSVEMLGVVTVSLIGLFVIRRVSWRTLSIILSSVLLLSNALSLYANGDYQLLLMLRFLAGMSGGGLVALSITALGDTEQIDRNFAYGVVAELLLSSIAFLVLPDWIQQHGVNVLFIVLMMLSLLGLAASFFVPSQGNPSRINRENIVWTPLWGLVATVTFFIAQSAIWAFVERIGVSASFTPQFIGSALSLSTVAGLAGAFTAIYVSKIMSRNTIMLLCATGQLLSLFGLLESSTQSNYLLAGLVFQFCWNLWLPVQMASIAAADVSGRLTVLIGSCQALGVAIGPTLVVLFMKSKSYLPANIVSGVFIGVALLLFLPINRPSNKVLEE